MNEVLLKGALKMLKNFITPDQIKQAAQSMMQKAIDYKNGLQMDTAAGETQIAAMQWEHKGEIFTSIVFLDSEDKILRYDQVKRVDEIVETLISKL
jgi:hypothetical protein